MKIADYFQLFDKFKRPIFLHSNNKKLQSTILGTLVSIGIYAFLLFYFFTSDMMTKKNPKISDQIVESDSAPEFGLGKVIFSLTDDVNNYLVDPTIFFVEVNIDYLKVNEKAKGMETVTSQVEVLRMCTPEDFEKGVYEKLGLKNQFCLNTSKLPVKGFWTDSEIKYIRADLKRCVNSTENNNSCKSEEEIDKYFSDFKYFTSYFMNPYFDLKDYDHPLRYVWRGEYQLTDPNILKTLELYFKKVEFTDDKNMPFVSTKYDETYSFDRKNTDFSYIKRSAVVSRIFLMSSISVQKKVRIYQGLPELFGNLGGLLGILLAIGFIITAPEHELNTIMCIYRERENYTNDAWYQRDDDDLRKNSIPIDKMNVKQRDQDKPDYPNKPDKPTPLSKSPHFVYIEPKNEIGKDSQIEIFLSQMGDESEAHSNEGLGAKGKSKNDKLPKVDSPSKLSNRLEIDLILKQFTMNNKKSQKENNNKTLDGHGEPVNMNGFEFSFGEFLSYNLKKNLKMKLSAKEEIFSKLKKNILLDINIGILIQRVYSLEKKIDYLLSNRKKHTLSKKA